MKGERESKRMAVPNNTYEAIQRLLSTEGVVILHKTQIPMNPVNLFEMLMGRGRSLTIEVDDTFVEEMRNLGGDSHS